MTKEDIEQYVKVIEIKPDSKYMLVVSLDSGMSAENMASLKLPDNFTEQSLLLRGNINDVIKVIPTA